MDRILFVVRNKIHMTQIDTKLMSRIVMRGNFKNKKLANFVCFVFYASTCLLILEEKKHDFGSARSQFKCVFSFVLKRFKAPASTLCCVYVFAAPAAPII